MITFSVEQTFFRIPIRVINTAHSALVAPKRRSVQAIRIKCAVCHQERTSANDLINQREAHDHHNPIQSPDVQSIIARLRRIVCELDRFRVRLLEHTKNVVVVVTQTRAPSSSTIVRPRSIGHHQNNLGFEFGARTHRPATTEKCTSGTESPEVRAVLSACDTYNVRGPQERTEVAKCVVRKVRCVKVCRLIDWCKMDLPNYGGPPMSRKVQIIIC